MAAAKTARPLCVRALIWLARWNLDVPVLDDLIVGGGGVEQQADDPGPWLHAHRGLQGGRAIAADHVTGQVLYVDGGAEVTLRGTGPAPTLDAAEAR